MNTTFFYSIYPTLNTKWNYCEKKKDFPKYRNGIEGAISICYGKIKIT
jgi:hypothetical protein